jgi:hypothetical protein
MISIKGNGRKIKNMVKDFSFGQMEENMTERF